eukprot:CAMPEP_0174266720 /NCGR_PEP_ID=MMETSP0439-20130205/31209_1 /TAXON_ID=0 /ORGANISM="Stereomyxa ramosa, Strain Chinc5" /LENGTH=525 /DNA_ID=CAMNT_0015353843 /DNA_START=878 /DNA_END=2452 /DNA_ORIENTATION=+
MKVQVRIVVGEDRGERVGREPFIDSIGSLVMIYIPEQHLHFIDCADDHLPTDSLLFNGAEFATSLPHHGEESEIVGFDGLMATYSDLRGHCIFDLSHGIIYEYTFNREALLRVFTLDNPDAHIMALHLAIVHMHDTELVDKIIRQVCSKRAELLTPGLIREYLLDMSYLSVKNLNIPTYFLKLLPATSIECLSTKRNKASKRTHIHVDDLEIPLTPNNRNLIPREKKRRFVGTDVLSTASPSLDSTNNNSPSIRNIFNKIFGIDDENSSQGEKKEWGTSESNGMDRWKFVEGLANYMFSSYPKANKSKCLAWAKSYRVKTRLHSNQLYHYISDNTNGFVRFQVMEHLYYILEELSFASPKGFEAEFAILGLKYLPRNVFLQYVERQVFHITAQFVDELFQALDNRTEDLDFKFAIIAKLPANEFSQTLQKYPENTFHLMENFHSGLPYKLPSVQVGNPRMEIERSNEKLQSTKHSSFVPLTIFISDLHSHNSSSFSRYSNTSINPPVYSPSHSLTPLSNPDSKNK